MLYIASKIKNGLLLFCLLLCGCITEYDPAYNTEAGILVVDGMITDDESMIILSRSLDLPEKNYDSKIYINDARVYVECDDGTLTASNPGIVDKGRYIVNTGKLDMARQYRLKIELDEPGNKTYEYFSDFSYPVQTPEIDSVFWIKNGPRQPVMIHIATHSPDSSLMYYRWQFKEDWEINSVYYSPPFPYYCWNKDNNNGLLLASTEKTVFGKLTEKIADIKPSDRKLSVLYRMDVKQNALSKRGFDYFSNIQQNDQQIGSIFAPVPAEFRGNITCVAEPGRLVIGYVDVSSTTQKRIYIPKSADVYESPFWDLSLSIHEQPSFNCQPLTERDLNLQFPQDYIAILKYYARIYLGNGFVNLYVMFDCVDCTFWGTEQAPEDWPNKYE